MAMASICYGCTMRRRHLRHQWLPRFEMRILITGGAGFIGSALTRRLASQSHSLVVLDTLSEQIHGADVSFSPALLEAAECVRGDVRNHELLARLIVDVDAVVHLAAETGTGQSMYALR